MSSQIQNQPKIHPRAKVRVAIAGIGNCASSLVQGVTHYFDATDEGTSTRAANCAAQLNRIGIDPTTFDPNSDPISPANTAVRGRTSGNRALNKETARTWTVGGVLRPRFLPGLQIAADWYDIRIKQAVTQVSAQEVVERCVDGASLANVFCSNISRDRTTGYINDFLVQPFNVASYDTEGLDVALNYRFGSRSSRLGSFNFRATGNYLHKLTFVPSQGADLENRRGEYGFRAPKYSGTSDITWSLGKVTLNYGVNWWDKTLRFSNQRVKSDPDITSPEYFYIKDKWEHEAQAAFDVSDRFNIYAGVNNLLDEKPDAGITGPVSSVGRFFYVGVKAKVF